MILAALFWAVAEAAGQDGDPGERVRAILRKLESDRPEEREQAEAQLVAVGTSALPALRTPTGGADLQARVLKVIARIEWNAAEQRLDALFAAGREDRRHWPLADHELLQKWLPGYRIYRRNPKSIGGTVAVRALARDGRILELSNDSSSAVAVQLLLARARAATDLEFHELAETALVLLLQFTEGAEPDYGSLRYRSGASRHDPLPKDKSRGVRIAFNTIPGVSWAPVVGLNEWGQVTSVPVIPRE